MFGISQCVLPLERFIANCNYFLRTFFPADQDFRAEDSSVKQEKQGQTVHKTEIDTESIIWYLTDRDRQTDRQTNKQETENRQMKETNKRN